MQRFLKTLAIILVAVSVVLAGSAMAAEHGGGGKKAPTSRSASEGAPKASESGGLGGSKVYVSIGPIILPVITDEGPQQIVTMIVSLQVNDTNDSDTVRQQLPRLIDAYMRALYGRLDASTLLHGTVVDVDFVKRKVAKATEEILGPGLVEDVLIQAISQRQV